MTLIECRPTPAGPAPEPGGPAGGYLRRLAATPELLGEVRREIRAWFEALGWPARDIDDAVLACHEAVSNSVEHAYPGDGPDRGWVEVRADLCGGRDTDGSPGRRVVLTVRDGGHWRPVPTDPGWRGRGLAMMRAHADLLTVRRRANGTTVELFTRLVPVVRSYRPA